MDRNFPGKPAAPDEARLVLLGVISKPQGLKGAVRMRPEFDDPDDFEQLKTDRLFLKEPQQQSLRPRKSGWYELTLEEFSEHQALLLLYFEGISDMNSAELLRGAEVYVYEDELWDLPEGRFYTFQLVGLEVFDQATNEVVGIVESIRPGVQDYLVVKTSAGGEFLVPYVPEILTGVDLASRRITADLPEGLTEV